MNRHIRHLEPGRPARQGQLILERRFRIARAFIDPDARQGRLLDIGCGNGAQTAFFASVSDLVVGIDIVPLIETENPADKTSFQFVRGSALELPFRDESFHTVTAFEVLEHVPDDARAIAEISRLIPVGGRFIYSLPNKWWLLETHGASIPGLNWIPWNRVPFVGWLPKFIHERIGRARIYTMTRALNLALSAGLQPVKWGYITAPLDVLSDGKLRKILRETVFNADITSIPFLAVNLYVVAEKV